MQLLFFTGIVPSPASIFVRRRPRAILHKWLESHRGIANGLHRMILTDLDVYRCESQFCLVKKYAHLHKVAYQWTDGIECLLWACKVDQALRHAQKLNRLLCLSFKNKNFGKKIVAISCCNSVVWCSLAFLWNSIWLYKKSMRHRLAIISACESFNLVPSSLMYFPSIHFVPVVTDITLAVLKSEFSVITIPANNCIFDT